MIFFIAFGVLVLFYTTDGQQFRFDYDYYPEAEGWLKLERLPATWKDAYLNCYYEGGVLASPENARLWSALKTIIANEQSSCVRCGCGGGVFTGVHATFGKGAYFSVTGTPLSRMPVVWAPGEPDNADGAEDCLLMLPNGSLADVNCSDTYPYVCYRKGTTNQTLNACGTVDEGYIFNQRTRKCYKVHTDPLNWTRAFVACAHEGGHLAIINSQVEAQVLKDALGATSNFVPGKYSKDVFFLGFRNFENYFLWMTIHGQTLKEAGYDKWDPNQPDQHYGRQDNCGAMFRNGRLDDMPCNHMLAFICEKDPASLLGDNILEQQ